MLTKYLLIAFILAAPAFSAKELSLRVTKGSFLFLKWVKISPVVTSGNRVEVSSNPISQWYVFAQYYEKIASGDLKVTLQYHPSDYSSDKSVVLTPHVEDDHINLTPDSPIDFGCADEDGHEIRVEKFYPKANSFTLIINFKCTMSNFHTAFDNSAQRTKDVHELPNQFAQPMANGLDEPKHKWNRKPDADFGNMFKPTGGRFIDSNESLKRRFNNFEQPATNFGQPKWDMNRDPFAGRPKGFEAPDWAKREEKNFMDMDPFKKNFGGQPFEPFKMPRNDMRMSPMRGVPFNGNKDFGQFNANKDFGQFNRGFAIENRKLFI